ncbi:MAG TPA: TIGR03435 family protein [Terriglobales bacterium]|nr:TIGR03435 family protein [Terriglobales bacterium]
MQKFLPARVPCAVLALLAFLPFAAAQQAAPAPAKLAFDVVSIKPAPDINTVIAAKQVPHVGTRIDGARVDMGFVSLQDLICTAYDVKPYQVTGSEEIESWLNKNRYDILATLPEGASKDQVPQMLQSLLTDRFHLAMHRDSHSLPVYALVVGDGGAKIIPAAPEAPAAAAPAPAAGDAKGSASFDTGDGGKVTVAKPSANGSTTMSVSGGKTGPMQIQMGPDGLELQAARMTLAQFADTLTGLVDRPVLDQTGLQGPYQIHLGVSRYDLIALSIAAMKKIGMPVPPQLLSQQTQGEASAPSGASVFASVQKLGLKLDATNAPIGRIVVDSAEKTPTAN